MSKPGLYQVEGGRKLRATLRAAGDDLTDLKNAHQDVANIAARAAKALAPVGETHKLRDGIRGSGTKTAAILRGGNNRKGNSGVPYAAVHHWGWPARKIPATLFLTRAAQQTEPAWVRVLEKYLITVNNKIEGK